MQTDADRGSIASGVIRPYASESRTSFGRIDEEWVREDPVAAEAIDRLRLALSKRDTVYPCPCSESAG